MVRAARRTRELPCISSHGLLSTRWSATPGCLLTHRAAIRPPVECPMSVNDGPAVASGHREPMMPIAVLISAS